MSWSLVLSSFPHSILTDKWPLLILSIIDRSGLATEEELANSLNLELSKTKSTLLKLKLNKLIDYGSNHVKLSEKGLQLLERLDLQDEVMEDFFNSINLHEEDRADFEKILKEYRKTSYKLFQNSICTLRQWKKISSNFPCTDEEISTQIIKESNAGMHCLLYRDLRNWISHYRPSQNTTESLSDRTRLLLFIDNIDEHKLYRENDYTYNCSIDYLKKIKTPINQQTDTHNKYLLINIFQHFNQFQSCYEPDLWFDKWAIEVRIPNWKKYKKVTNYFENLNNEIINYTPYKNENVSIVSLFRELWRHYSSEPTHSFDFLENLFISNNISELSQKVGIPEPAVEILLGKITKSCEELLKENQSNNEIKNAQQSHSH